MVKDKKRVDTEDVAKNQKSSFPDAMSAAKKPASKQLVPKSSPVKSIITIRPEEKGGKKLAKAKSESSNNAKKSLDEGVSNQAILAQEKSSQVKNSTKAKNKRRSSKKCLSKEELLFQGVDIKKPICFYKPSDQDLIEYSNKIKTRKDINFSLNIFLSEKYNGNKEKLLIADLRDMEISAGKEEKQFDLRGANFRGSLFKNTRFVNCDLTDAYFSDSVLRGVRFRHSNLERVDLRGCNLEDCRFGREYESSSYKESSNIKVSMSLSELRIFADIKNEIARKNEEQRILDTKRYEMREISRRTSFYNKAVWFLGGNIDDGPYKKVMQELQEMEAGKFTKEYIVHKSAENLIKNKLCSFYPVFGKGFKDMKKVRHKRYVKLTREDLEEFTAITDNPVTLSLNEFAEKKYLDAKESGATIPEDTMIVADLSSKVNKFGNNEWNRMNLSGISFINRDMSFVNFSGTDLSKCNFSNSNLHGSNLDCCNLVDSIFTLSNLTDCSMVNVDLSGSVFEDVTLVRSNISWSNLVRVKIMDSNVSYINCHNSNLNKSYFENLSVDGSNFDKVSLEKSRFIKCSFRNSSFVKSKWSAIKMEKVSFNGSIFNHTEMKNSFWDNVELQDVEAMHVDLTESKFSEGSIIKESNFRHSLFDAVRVSLCKIIDSDFDYAKIAYGKFGGTELIGSHFRFSNFDNVTLAECNAENADFSGAKMYNTRLMKTNLKNTNFSGAKITDSDLTGASFENSIWYSLKLDTSIIERVNNHRIKINDSTLIDKCLLKNLEGQFYHYDQDDFMEIMFIEQQQSHQQYVKNILKIKKMGFVVHILKFFVKDYNISTKDRNIVIKSRRRNRINLKNHFQEIKDTPLKVFVDIDEFHMKNIIASHNYSNLDYSSCALMRK